MADDSVIPFINPPEEIPFITPPEQKNTSLGSAVRDVGRGVAKGVAGLAEMAMPNFPIIKPIMSHSASKLNEVIGSYETETGRYAGAAGGGAATGALFGAATGGPPGAVMGGITGATSGIASEAAGDLTEGSPEWVRFGARILASIAASMGTEGVIRQGGKLISSVVGGASKNPMVAAYQAEGVTPRLAGDVTERGSLRGVQAGLERYAAAEPIRKAARETVDEVGAAVEKTASGYGNASTITGAGSSMQQSVRPFFDEMKGRFQEMDDALSKLVPKEIPTIPNKTLGIIDDLNAKFGTDTNTAQFFKNSDVSKLITAIEKDIGESGGIGIRFGTLQAARSRVGEMMADPNVQKSIPKAELSRLYGALSEDMKTAMQNSPEALKLFNTQNKFWSAVSSRMDDTMESIAKAGSPEMAYNIAMQGGKQGGSRLFSIKRSMEAAGKSQEWDDMVAGIIERMGKSKPDSPFDPVAFLRSYQSLPQNTKTALFYGADKAGYAQSLERLSTIANSMKESSKLANTSNTAGTWWLLNMMNMAAGGIVGTAVGGPGLQTMAAGAMGGIILPNAAARLITQPWFTKWLATPVPVERLPMHIKSLNALAQSYPEFKDDLMRISNAAQSRLGIK